MMITIEPSGADASVPVHRFSHLAMAAPFEIRIRHADGAYAAQAAWDAFALLDRLEQEFSRYIDSSDVSQLNALPCGELLVLGEAAYACLCQARVFYEATGGAFDVTAGALKDLYRPERSFLRCGFQRRRQVTGMRHIHLEEGWRVWKEAPVQVDLGAIGKGFAVERMAERLLEWQMGDFLVHGGASSVAARGCAPGRTGWPVTLRHPVRPETILEQLELRDQAMGASGLQKGEHIIDPRTGRAVHGVAAAWVRAGDAATADALSTAMMLLCRQKAEQLVTGQKGLGALVIYDPEDAGEVLRLGMDGH